jgi:hypothetical protein
LLKRFGLILTLCVLLAACGGSADEPSAEGSSSPGADELIVQAANYELIAGEDSRFIAGLLTPDSLLGSFATVEMEFFYLGTKEGEGTAEEGPTATADFLPIEGTEAEDADTTQATSGSEGRGVYAAEVSFDRPGYWAAQVTADLPDGSATGRAIFEVFEENRYPAVGERAPRTDNLTLSTKDAPTEAIDSRARDGEEIPDPELHRMTIADSIRRGEPALVVFATPVYCVSRFCGPITDMAAALAADYGDKVNVIHVEIWRDFQNTVVNKGAAEWIYRDEDLTEPWIYLIDSKGKIAARWDNVAARQEIEPLLEELPSLEK